MNVIRAAGSAARSKGPEAMSGYWQRFSAVLQCTFFMKAST